MSVSCVTALVAPQMVEKSGVGPTATETYASSIPSVSYTHLRAHETVLDLVCRLLLEKKQHTENVN